LILKILLRWYLCSIVQFGVVIGNLFQYVHIDLVKRRSIHASSHILQLTYWWFAFVWFTSNFLEIQLQGLHRITDRLFIIIYQTLYFLYVLFRNWWSGTCSLIFRVFFEFFTHLDGIWKNKFGLVEIWRRRDVATDFIGIRWTSNSWSILVILSRFHGLGWWSTILFGTLIFLID